MSLQSHEFREAVQYEVEKEKERAQEVIHQHKERWVTCRSHEGHTGVLFIPSILFVPSLAPGWHSRSRSTRI